MARLVEFPSPFSLYQFNRLDNNDSDLESLSLNTYWGWTIAPPFILAFGTFGNIMIIVILCRLGSSASNSFFQALVISDLLVLYTGLFPEWLENSFNASFRNIHSLACKLYFFLSYATGAISAWLIVAMTLHRAVSVVWPLRVSIICSGRRISILVCLIHGVFLLLYSHMLYGYDLVTMSNITSPECAPVTDDYNWFMGETWTIVSTLCQSLLPFTFLAFSNTVLVLNVKTSVRTVTHSSAQTDQRALRKKKASSLTLTLIVVSVTFVVLSLPIFIHHIVRYYVFARLFNAETTYRHALSFSHCITLMVWYCNSAVNFYIYCLTGTRFKQEVKLVFCKFKSTVANHMNAM